MKRPEFEMIGSLDYKGKTYSITDNKGIVDATSMGLVNFYGGRVKRLGKTKVKGLYLCLEDNEAINLIKFSDDSEVVETPFVPQVTNVPEEGENEEDANEEDIIDDDTDISTDVVVDTPTQEPEPEVKAPNLPRPANRSKANK